ncbi:hypothetical protein BDW02DRAFT_533909, partial [Decorospora gaudefroyi]
MTNTTIILASLPFLAQATYLDPLLRQQKPLSQPTSDRVVELTLDADLHYHIPTNSDIYPPLPLQDLQKGALGTDHEIVTINIPLNASMPGSATLSKATKKDWRPQSTSQITWIESPNTPADAQIPLLDISIRKGGMISTEADSATLDLSTPFLHVPTSIWDILVLATQPRSETASDELVVDCAKRRIFPDLVFGMDGERGEDELVVRPEQYVLRTEDGACKLLVRSSESCHDGGVVIG